MNELARADAQAGPAGPARREEEEAAPAAAIEQREVEVEVAPAELAAEAAIVDDDDDDDESFDSFESAQDSVTISDNPIHIGLIDSTIVPVPPLPAPAAAAPAVGSRVASASEDASSLLDTFYSATTGTPSTTATEGSSNSNNTISVINEGVESENDSKSATDNTSIIEDSKSVDASMVSVDIIPVVTDAGVSTPAVANTPAVHSHTTPFFSTPTPATMETVSPFKPSAIAVGTHFNAVGAPREFSSSSRSDSLPEVASPALKDLTSALDEAVNSLNALSVESLRGSVQETDPEETSVSSYAIDPPGPLRGSLSGMGGGVDMTPVTPLRNNSNSMAMAMADIGADDGSTSNATGNGNGSAAASNNNNNNTRESQSQLRTSITSVSSEASLPSYNFQPRVREKSDRILRSYRPSIPAKFRGSSLLSFRRPGSRSSTAAAGAINAAASGATTNNGATTMTSNNLTSVEESSLSKSNKKKNEATITEVPSDEEGGTVSSISNNNSNHNHHSSISIGSLLKDTYSFLYVYPICSAPFFYAILLFSFQSLVYALLLSTLIDTTNRGNMLHVPPVVGTQMRIAQACAILIAVVNSVDVMVAMNNLLRTPDKIVVLNNNNNNNGNGNGNGSSEMMTTTSAEDRAVEISMLIGDETRRSGMLPEAHARTNVPHNANANHQVNGGQSQSFHAGFKFKFANFLRLIEGCLAVTASFILIVRSDDIIEMFINFAALEFVVNLDNLAFALAEHGLISDRLKDAARFVDTLGFCYLDGDHHPHSSNGGSNGNGSHRRSRKGNRGNGCTPGRVAQLKGSYISRLFGSPFRLLKRHPDGARRTILLVMIFTLFGMWAWILSGLNGVDHLPKSIDVDFFHAHVEVDSRGEAEEGLKPFLASRDGNYVAAFVEGESSFLDTLLNTFAGRSNTFLMYRKMDPKVPTPQEQFAGATAPAAMLPSGYADVLFYDPDLKAWIFTSCDPNVDLLREKPACAGPQVRSMETEELDLTALSLSPDVFHVVAPDDPNAVRMTLPAMIKSNECGVEGGVSPAAAGLRSADASCGAAGGMCLEPLEELGFARQCLCPTGQYGPHCAVNYGASCPVINVIFEQDPNEPPGAAHFAKWEERQFNLMKDERGVGNTPIWERLYENKAYSDRLEWQGGGYWSMTRTQVTLNIVHTIAIAEGTLSLDGTPDPGAIAGGAGLTLDVQQQTPAGLLFHAPKAAAWGTQPDYFRPFSSYQLRCKVAVDTPMNFQLTGAPR